MPLQLASPPPNAYDLLAEAVSRLSLAEGAADQVTKVRDPSRLNSALPHQVYTLGSRDIAEGRNLTRAQLVAWRFLIQYGSKTIAAVELACDVRGGNLRFSSLDTGPFAPGTRDLVTQVEGFDAVKRGQFELRALKAPSVYVMAVWLKSLDGQEDIVIPVNPAHAGGPGPASLGGAPLPRSPQDFFQELRSPAQTALRFYGTPERPNDQRPLGEGRDLPPPRRPRKR